MPKTIKHRRKWTNKYKKSINCKKPRGFSQKQYCAKKRVKKTMKGGIGENMAMNATRNVLKTVGHGFMNGSKQVIKDTTKRELFDSEYSRKFGQNENVNPNLQFYDKNQENFINTKFKVDNNVISSKKGASITPPSIDF